MSVEIRLLDAVKRQLLDNPCSLLIGFEQEQEGVVWILGAAQDRPGAAGVGTCDATMYAGTLANQYTNDLVITWSR
jgi:hypothetical protein